MFHITQTVSVLRDVETVMKSDCLGKADQEALVVSLLQQLTDRTPHGAIVIKALRRHYKLPEPQPRREAEGQQDAAEVAPGSDSAEAAKGTPEGEPEQAEDAGSVPDASDEGGPTSKATAPAQKPKSKTRHAR